MIKGRVNVIKKDTGLRRFTNRARKLASRGPVITVGVHGDAEGEYEGISVLEIAAFHEFGLGVPQRSFVRAWAEEKRSEIDRSVAAQARAIVLGKVGLNAGLDQLGSLFKASMQARISEGIEPPNEESTEDRKGSSTPLIDTGQLRASIDFKVEQ